MMIKFIMVSAIIIILSVKWVGAVVELFELTEINDPIMINYFFCISMLFSQLFKDKLICKVQEKKSSQL